MKRYPKYKDSGVEWIGEIPDGWTSTKIGRLTYLGRGRVISNIEIADNPGQYPVYSSQTANNGMLGYINSFDFEGDYVTWTTDGANAGTVFFRDGKFNCTNVCGTMIPKGKNSIYLPYVPYLLNLGTKYHVRYDINPKLMNAEMAQIDICLPTFPEQKSIANYLDDKTYHIDTLIEKKQKQIELLKEQRTAIINNAVTKGLNPDVKMKDSGIEWLGEIPAYWDVVRNKVIFTEVNDRSESGKEELLTVSHITGVTPRKDKEVTMFLSESLIGYKLCEKGDLIINTMWAWMGALGITDNVYRVKDKKRVFPIFYDFLYRTPASVSEITRHSKGIWSSRLRLYPEIFFNILTLVPPYSEQKEIVNYLQNKTNIIEKYISENKNMIDFLTEYRTTLISDAVTGKIDVRNEVPS